MSTYNFIHEDVNRANFRKCLAWVQENIARKMPSLAGRKIHIRCGKHFDSQLYYSSDVLLLSNMALCVTSNNVKIAVYKLCGTNIKCRRGNPCFATWLTTEEAGLYCLDEEIIDFLTNWKVTKKILESQLENVEMMNKSLIEFKV